MPHRRAVLLGLTAALAAPAQARTAAAWPGFERAERRDLPAPAGARIVEYTLFRSPGRGLPVSLVWAEGIAPGAGMGIVPVERRGQPGPLYRGVAAPHAVAAINGSFFEGRPNAREHPMGLVRLNGRTAYPTSRRQSGGFLILDGGAPVVVDRRHDSLAESALWAVESSPILVINGASGMRRDDQVRADRVAAGTTANDHPVLVGAFGQGQDAVSLFAFEQLARRAAADQGETLRHLIAMDGGPSAHLLLSGSGQLYGAGSSIYLTNLVTLTVG